MSEQLLTLRLRLAEVAQSEYDHWLQDKTGYDEELGAGGICHLIADRMVEVLSLAGIDCSTTHSEGIGENHVWVTALTPQGIFVIDIPPHVYEVGSGFSWKKKPGVRFSENDIMVDLIDDDPKNYRQYLPDADFLDGFRL